MADESIQPVAPTGFPKTLFSEHRKGRMRAYPTDGGISLVPRDRRVPIGEFQIGAAPRDDRQEVARS